ncbi:MAG TPA: 16S rRNA (guanine(966)-N(2))-methyltransferase RsmD [Legionella sp.]|nr:16S rRNA (guanine(966)-N(2))-methyltransferase RsmD [Legionella sp.]
MKQTIRIIGGQYRGKKLAFPDLDGLRPTPDRVRETLFNWLMHFIRGARCLDAFSGSGALGFEAFSRGASRVVFIERAPTAFAHLQKVAAAFHAPALKVVLADACMYMQQTSEPFDIVFVDPPFDQSHLLRCIETLAHSPLLVEGGLLYLETPVERVLDARIWEVVKSKKSGQVVYALYRKRMLDKETGSCFNQ